MKVVVSEFISLDGVVQAPGGPEEDTSGGFRQGGWSGQFFDPEGIAVDGQGNPVDDDFDPDEASSPTAGRDSFPPLRLVNANDAPVARRATPNDPPSDEKALKDWADKREMTHLLKANLRTFLSPEVAERTLNPQLAAEVRHDTGHGALHH